MQRQVFRNSLIDFANKDLGTKIYTAAITIDGCEVENLIDTQLATFHQSKSFMSEYYIKCPVEIILTFPCLINISAILLEPRVSSHRSKCIELYTAFQRSYGNCSSSKHAIEKNKKTNKTNTKSDAGYQSPEYPYVYTKDLTIPTVREENQHLLNFVGKYKDPLGNNEFPDVVVFTNPRHEQIYESQSFNSFKTNLRTYPSTRACSHLIIKITWATIPVLKKLEVWGTLSNLNTPTINRHVNEIILKQNKLNASIDVVSDPPAYQINEEHKKKIQNVPNINIPEEFIDPITFSIMTVPLLLPSGNIVDQDTLDKYIVEEEKYGRLPSDPFTGIIFHGSKQPVPNSSLKLRIDEFLLKNNNILEINGQTTGTKSQISTTINMLHKNDNKSLKRGLQNDDNNTYKKVRTDSFSKVIAEECKLDKTNDNSKHLSRNSSIQSSSSSHEYNLKESLDLSMYETLSWLPIRNNSINTAPSLCSKCFRKDEKNLFSLPCKHLLCRSCLLVVLKANKKCISCHYLFDRKDVIKFHHYCSK